jgi:hypothetical protein
MKWKRLSMALLFAFVVALLLDIVVNAVLLRKDWVASLECWRPASEMNRLVPLGWGSMLLAMVFQSAIFVRAKWQGIRRGLEFGCWLGLAGFVGIAGGMTSVVAWPARITLGMALQQFINNIVIGYSLGWLYRIPSPR